MRDRRPVATVHVEIDDSGALLSQADWAAYVIRVATRISVHASAVLGTWHSHPASAHRGACWAFELPSAHERSMLRAELVGVRESFGQTALVWSESKSEFV